MATFLVDIIDKKVTQHRIECESADVIIETVGAMTVDELKANEIRTVSTLWGVENWCEVSRRHGDGA